MLPLWKGMFMGSQKDKPTAAKTGENTDGKGLPTSEATTGVVDWEYFRRKINNEGQPGEDTDGKGLPISKAATEEVRPQGELTS
jgi:hypothetical protein